MCYKNLGVCGSFLRLILCIFNLLLLIVGGVIFVTAAIVRWNPSIIIGDSNSTIESMLNISALNSVSIALLSIGGFLILLGLIGLIGTLCTSKSFLVLYEFVIVVIFLSHGFVLLYGAFKSNELEDEFRKELNRTMDNINSYNTTGETFKGECDLMRAFSKIFDCCGATGPQDFVNVSLISQCCEKKDFISYVGCADKTVDTVSTNAVEFILAPNVAFLLLELILIVLIPFLVSRIKREHRYEHSDRNINYLRPTTEFRKSYGSTMDYTN